VHIVNDTKISSFKLQDGKYSLIHFKCKKCRNIICLYFQANLILMKHIEYLGFNNTCMNTFLYSLSQHCVFMLKMFMVKII